MSTLQSDHVLNAEVADSVTPKGVVLCAYGKYECDGTQLEINDVVEMVTIPKGAIVLGGFLRITGTDFDAGATVDVGWTGGDVNCFITGADPSGQKVSTPFTEAAAIAAITTAAGQGVPLAASDTIDAICLTAASGASSILEVCAFYSIVQ